MPREDSTKKKDQSQSGPEAPHNLEANARAYFKNAESFRKKKQQRRVGLTMKKKGVLPLAFD